MSYKKVSLASFDNHRNTENNKEYIYSKPYRGITTDKRRVVAANIASGNGRCWWVYTWVYYNYK